MFKNDKQVQGFLILADELDKLIQEICINLESNRFTLQNLKIISARIEEIRGNIRTFDDLIQSKMD